MSEEKKDVKYTLKADDKACSIGMLRSSVGFPDTSLPVWANTVAKRMMDMGITNRVHIKNIIEEMEKERRRKFRAELGSGVPITEFDEHLADLFNRFEVKK